MAGLETVLRISAKDDAGPALAKVKAQIAEIDKQIAVFDKMSAAVGKITKATDPMLVSINASTRALAEQRGAVAELAEGAEVAAGAQRTLGEAIMSTTRMMVAQGVEAVKVAGKIVASQKTAAKGAARAHEGGGGGIGIGAGAAAVGGLLVPYAIAEGGAKALEAGASLEQLKLRVREVSGGKKTEAPFAEQLAAEIAAKYPAITQAKALDTYLELRGNAANQNGTVNQETARCNLMTVSQAQTAVLAIGSELTPEDAQNLLKAVEGSGRAGDPAMLKVFTQQDLGEPYEPKNDTPDWEKLLAVRKVWKRGVVPWPASVLTGFIDVQGNRFEWGLWAWGEGFQGWLIDRGVIAHDYTEDQAWAAIDALTSRRWPTAGGGEVDVMSWGIDTGAFTQALYDHVGVRHALLATKGDNRPSATPLKKGRADLRDHRGRSIAGRRLNLAFIGNFDLKLSVYEGLLSLVAGPEPGGAWRPGTLHLPDWIGEDELRQLTAEVLIDPREYEVAASNKRRGALIKTDERREWRKKPHQANEALDIVVGARALAWGEGAGQLTASDWRERAAEAHGALEQPTLFSAPLVAPGTPARGVSEEQIEQIQRAVEARGAEATRA
jgi:Phage terminase large subunit (GpA)